MADDSPFAIHITWTCYGTWLPGDPRGYVSNTLHPGGGFDPRQNIPGTPYTRDDPLTRVAAVEALAFPPVWLTGEQAVWAVVAFTAAARRRGWKILRAAVMANHAHVVVADCPDDGPAVRRVLKGVSSAAMSRRLGRPFRWWTAGGSDRYKHDHPAIDTAVNYVADQPGMLAGVENTRPFRVGAAGIEWCDPGGDGVRRG